MAGYSKSSFIDAAIQAGLKDDEVESAMRDYRAQYGGFEDEGGAAAEPESRLRDDVTFAGSEGAGRTASGLFPRTAEAVAEGKGYGKQVLSAGLDLVSLPGRAVASLGRDEGEGYLESVADTEGKSFVGRALRDPGTGASVLTAPVGGLVAGAAGKALLPAALKALPQAPKVASILTNTARAGAAGLAEGASSATAHQAENVRQGKGVDMKEAALETGLTGLAGGALTGLGQVAGEGLKKGGAKILDSVIKPKVALTEAIGSKFDVENVFKYGLDSPKGLQAMDDKILEFRQAVNAEYGDDLAKLAGKKLNVRAALSRAERELMDEFKAGKHAADWQGVQQGIEHWKDYLANTNLNVKGGWMPIDDAVSMRGGVGVMARYDKMDPKAIKGAEKAAQKFYAELNDQIENRYPQLRGLDEKLSETAPVRKAVKQAIHRTGKNFAPTLTDVISLSAAAGGAGYAQDKEGALPGLAVFLGNRALKSPGVSSVLYRSGKKLASPSKLRNALAFGARRAVASDAFREEEEKP